MNEEEIKEMYKELKRNKKIIGSIDVDFFFEFADAVLNLLEKKDKKIEYYKNQKRYDEQFKHELLEKIRCKSLTIDSLNKILDDRLICIQGGRGLYTKLKGLDKEYLIREYLSIYKTCKQELKKKDKQIDEIQKEVRDHIGFENRLKRDNKEPDLFNQGRFYVANNINNILR